jgi:hypothetical protein
MLFYSLTKYIKPLQEAWAVVHIGVLGFSKYINVNISACEQLRFFFTLARLHSSLHVYHVVPHRRTVFVRPIADIIQHLIYCV